MNLLPELHRWYLEMGVLSLFAWIGSLVIAAFVALIVVAVTDLRLPRPAELVDRLKARNARILNEREARRG